MACAKAALALASIAEQDGLMARLRPSITTRAVSFGRDRLPRARSPRCRARSASASGARREPATRRRWRTTASRRARDAL
jgi:hypothetical protein